LVVSGVSLVPLLSSSSPGRLSGVHILVVDDDPDALALSRETLEAAGATVTTCPAWQPSAKKSAGPSTHTSVRPARVAAAAISSAGSIRL